MESLTPAQKTTVTKSSTERLRLLLLKSGYAEKVVLGWSREQLMIKYAELLAQGWDPTVVTRPVDPELEKMRLAHEVELKRMEMEEREKKRELQEKELEAEKERKELREKELEDREKELEAEKQRKEMELELEKQRGELRQKELDAERDKWCRLIVWQPKGWNLREKLKSEDKLKEQEIDVIKRHRIMR